MKNETIKSIVDLQINLIFDSIADEFNLQNGDITLQQSLQLEDIQEKLFFLLKDYVKQNK